MMCIQTHYEKFISTQGITVAVHPTNRPTNQPIHRSTYRPWKKDTIKSGAVPYSQSCQNGSVSIAAATTTKSHQRPRRRRRRRRRKVNQILGNPPLMIMLGGLTMTTVHPHRTRIDPNFERMISIIMN
jgi:hypothetical protein